ncbi:MAG: glycosyltransferase [Acidaminococcaceae bacterium]|nr:glycosyltransferase [Acidaminococcaceae bacterium]
MNQKTIISIVVPVYNSKEYLPTCLGSLINQTIGADKMEIILVDDGSTDGSVEYLKEFADQNKNVKLFCLPHNTGDAGYVRNIGIKAATGDWLFCVDSDDWLGPEALERLVKHAEEWDSDVVQGKMINVDGVGRKGKTAYFNSNRESIVNGELAMEKILSETVGPWRLIKMDLLKTNHILFPEGMWPHDVIFMLEVLFAAKHISIANDYEYYFLRRDSYRNGGLSKTTSMPPAKRPDRIVKSMQRVFDVIDKNSKEPMEYLIVITKIFFYQLGHAIAQIGAYAEQSPEQYCERGKIFKEKLWERVQRYYTPELRALLPVTKAVRWDYAQHGIYDESEIAILPFCTPKAVNSMKLRPDVAENSQNVSRLPELSVLAEDTWQRLRGKAIKAAVICVTDVKSVENLKILVTGTYDYPLLITEQPEICPVLQYNDQLLFAESTIVRKDVWGEPYQGRGRWEAVFSVKEWIKNMESKIKIGFYYRYDEKQAAVINSYRDDRFAESAVSITMTDAGNADIYYKALLNLGNLIERGSVDEQLKNAKKTIKQYTAKEKELKGKLNQVKGKLSQANRKFNKANEKLNKADCKLNKISRELNNVKTSKSWKLTKPFRMVGEIVRKVLN